VLVEDFLPAGVAVESVSVPGGTCIAGVPGDPFRPTTCALGSLVPSTSKVITIVVRVRPGKLKLARNDARVVSDTFDPDSSDNLATETTTIAIADLKLTKETDFDIYKRSSTVVYRIKVLNKGPASAENVVVTDSLPPAPDATYLRDTGGCVKAGLILTCNLGEIGPQKARTFNIHLRIKAKDKVKNSASVTSSTFDPGPSPNTATRTILID
jgi:uncharacterized repeat protein (TIGR01451 family)